jgi:23S rRNA pseudouridine1911/1915/1917 synthase
MDIGHDIIISVQPLYDKLRIDSFLSQALVTYSRSFFQKLIEKGCIKVNGKELLKYSTPVRTGDLINILFPEISQNQLPDHASLAKLNIEIIYEHKHFFIINKPAHLVVHRPQSNSSHVTLVDWLISYSNDLIHIGPQERPAIVHRLDKDTSGIMIIPRTQYSYDIFHHLFKNRAITKVYNAVVQGHPPLQASIELAIQRHPTKRTRMTHSNSTGRASLTNYKVLQYFKDSALIEAYPITGRTHQIRVHCAAIGHPILGDPVYGKASPLITRQALHAHKVTFTFDNQNYTFTAPIPADIIHLLEQILTPHTA